MIQIDHTEYPRSLKAKSAAALKFIIQDASEAARINPNGDKNGYYLDEVNYAAMELAARAKVAAKFINLTGALDQAREAGEPFPASRVV